ncbi:unnamed protein product [Rotaria magnacalcarata]|uniref:Poly [ADP-ribose] polymerase n=12 Tax=Rotaria magnacalcarata TaxID=392030 RepID=A0A814WWS6_9BILA|nr:unnamed protein product [Rotaria magnacalcarata]
MLPLRTIPAIAFSIIAYFMMNLQRTTEKFLIFFVFVSLISVCASSLCFLVSATVKHFVASLFCVIAFVFGGFLVEISTVLGFLQWIQHLSIFRYRSNAPLINEFIRLRLRLPTNTRICGKDGAEVLTEFKIDHGTNWDLLTQIVNDEKQLKLSLTKIIDIAQECIQKFNSYDEQTRIQAQTSIADDNLLENSQLNNNIYTFTLNDEENELVQALTSNIEAILNEDFEKLSQLCLNYLLDFLHTYHYDRERRQFLSPLNVGALHPFVLEIKGLLASSEAFPAAFNGNLEIVKKFIKEYPTFKDKPGLWETTLLFSAARNNHLEIVKYLIEEAHCSVNAQNQREVEFALNTSSTNYTPRPTAASTALHAACYYNHLSIVRYLVQHGADYFIRNQAHETPIYNGERHNDIKSFFQDYLIMGYSIAASATLPDRTIMNNDDRPIRDSMWEYKPFQDLKWYRFTATEATILHNALLPSDELQQQVYLTVTAGLYSVSILEFVRSGKYEQDPQKNMAWIRCRGSSILNFDCSSIWHIMLIQHQNVNKDTDNTPSLKIQEFPVMRDSRFKLQLNTWYSCDDKTTSSIDNAMNYRRKIITIDIPYIGDKLTFNLQTFEFSNDDKTIFGYIRWIPKLISNTEYKNKKLVHVDNYQPTASIQPILLTTQRRKQVLQVKNTDQQHTNGIENHDEEDETGLQIATVYGTGNDDEADDDDFENMNKKNDASSKNNGTWTITDLDDDTMFINSEPDRTSNVTPNTLIREDSKIHEDFFRDTNDKIKHPGFIERANSTLTAEASAALASQFASEVQELKDQIEKEKLKVEQEKQSQDKMTKEKEDELKRINKLLKELQKQLVERKAHEQQLNNLVQQIIAIDYDNIESIVANIFLFGKVKNIIEHLKTKHPVDTYLIGIPNITITDSNDLYCISVTGTKAHHDEFKRILERIQKLSNATELAKKLYQHQLNSKFESVNYIMTKQIRSSEDWKHYTKYYQQLLKNKIEDFVKLYNEYILQKAKLMMDDCIKDVNFQSQRQLKKLTDTYMKKKQFLPELEILKSEALDEYVKQHVLSERLKFEKKPSKEALGTMHDLIGKARKEFKTNPTYIGCQVEQFKEIPKVLQRIMLYYRCFLLQLPLYESAKTLLEKIKENTVITIATSTGSGKSSLLPALLIAEGYDKVIVTQPRRLPCTAICERVNETMMTNKNELRIAGWAVSGDERDVNARILYLTDGLLKERLLHDENLIANQANNKTIVFFLDEVHERSVNIDLCLGLFARLLTNKPEIKSKVKIIISSATLDTSVPTLYRQIAQLKFDEFKMPTLGTLHSVTKIPRPNQNILDLVQELCKKKQRHDQILCFVSSVSEVKQCCNLLEEISHGTLTAYPLIQSQSAADQQNSIEHGSIFFSTTVAETSLTFPSLKYVVDTGMINIPVYDSDKRETTLMEIRAAESTIKQRLGRLGRTQPGEYYSLYDFQVEDKKYPIPQICQSDLINIEFSLRKSLIKNGLHFMKKFLPDSPDSKAINAAIEELKRLNIVDSHDKFTSVGVAISKLPDFGSLAMSKAVLSALNQHNCGRDLIVLSSILSVLNTSSVLKAIPSSMKRSEGDFMTLLNVMNEILLVRESVHAQQFRLSKVCQVKNLTPILHVIKQALRRYINLEKSFNLSAEYREKAQVSSDDWESIAKSLLNGYGENVFVSMKELQGRTHIFTRYSPPKHDEAVLDLQSTLTRAISSAPVSLVLARDIRFSSSIRHTAVLSFVGEIKSQWIEYHLNRNITLNTAEEAKLNQDNILATTKQAFPNIQIQLNNHILSLKGSAGSVLDAELNILQQLVVEMKFTLKNEYPTSATTDHARMKRNLEGVSKMPSIFTPMKWRWEAQHQVKITVNNNVGNNECEIIIEGRDSQNQLVQKEFQSFLGWLKRCAVIRHPNAGVPPRIIKPAMRKSCLDMEEKISHITDSKRTSIELWKALKGSKATRETRMEVVAWIAVCKFDCRLEGGFVRDWIVGNCTARPSGYPSTWVTYQINATGTILPYLDKDLIPSDLDCHLPSHKYFDIDKFLDNLHKYQIEYTVYREDWRYVILLDENAKTGPFTMDLIEPHVALTHDRIDFDVSNLSLEKDYTKELGMRVDITYKPYSIELETIVDNIKNKRFQVLRPVDKYVQPRIAKMESRGWTQLGKPMHVIPNPPPKYQVVLVPLPESTDLYQTLVHQMKSYINNQVQVLSIEQIKNPLLEEAYLAMKEIIAKQCKGKIPNERELFHGTKGEAIDGVLNDGFDDRYWGGNFSKCKWGHGAYFADNPSVSHRYTEANTNDQTRIMYYNKVVLGNESILQEQNSELMSAPKGYHSTHGQFPGQPNDDEYIVYRYGQALPYLRITYTA